MERPETDAKVREVEQKFDEFFAAQMPVHGIRRSAILSALLDTAELLCVGIRPPTGDFGQALIALFLNVSNGLNKSLRLAHQSSVGDSEEIYDYDDLIEVATECIALGGVPYHAMELAFYSYWKGYAEATFPSEKELIFVPSGSDLNLNSRLRFHSTNDALNPVNAVFNNPFSTELIGSPLTREFAESLMKTGKVEDGQGFVYDIEPAVIDSVADAHLSFLKAHFDGIPDISIGTITLFDLIEGWSVVNAVCQIHHLVSLLMSDRGDLSTSINSPTLFRGRAQWLRWFSTIRSAEEVLRVLTFDFDDPNSDIAITPLVKIMGEDIGVVPTLTLTSNVPRNVFVLLARKFNQAYSTYTASKEAVLLKSFTENYGDFVVGTNIKLPTHGGVQLPDVDLLLSTDLPNILVLAELKWQLTASTVKETIDRNEYLKKGQRQLLQIRSFLKDNPKHLKDRGYVDFEVTEKNVTYLLLCKGHLGSEDVVIPETLMADYDVFVRYLTEFDMSETLRRLAAYDYLPMPDTDFTLSDLKVRFNEWIVGWKGFTLPDLPPDNETEVVEDFYRRSGKFLA